MHFNLDADINVHGPGSSAERAEQRRTWQEKERDKRWYKERIEKWEKQQSKELKSETFKGVNVWISGYTEKSSDLQLKNLVSSHGGRVSWFFSATRTTHIICTNLAAAKIERMLHRIGAKKFIPVVHPDWILQSVKQRKLLPEHDFRVIQQANQNQLDQYFIKPKDRNDIEDKENENDCGTSAAAVVPQPVYSPKKTYNTNPLKLSPKKNRIDAGTINNNTMNIEEKEQKVADPHQKALNKENCEHQPMQIDNKEEIKYEDHEKSKNKDKALKNIDIRTGKVIKSTTGAIFPAKKISKKLPLVKLVNLFANNDQFKNIPNVAKKTGPVTSKTVNK